MKTGAEPQEANCYRSSELDFETKYNDEISSSLQTASNRIVVIVLQLLVSCCLDGQFGRIDFDGFYAKLRRDMKFSKFKTWPTLDSLTFSSESGRSKEDFARELVLCCVKLAGGATLEDYAAGKQFRFCGRYTKLPEELKQVEKEAASVGCKRSRGGSYVAIGIKLLQNEDKSSLVTSGSVKLSGAECHAEESRDVASLTETMSEVTVGKKRRYDTRSHSTKTMSVRSKGSPILNEKNEAFCSIDSIVSGIMMPPVPGFVSGQQSVESSSVNLGLQDVLIAGEREAETLSMTVHAGASDAAGFGDVALDGSLQLPAVLSASEQMDDDEEEEEEEEEANSPPVLETSSGSESARSAEIMKLTRLPNFVSGSIHDSDFEDSDDGKEMSEEQQERESASADGEELEVDEGAFFISVQEALCADVLPVKSGAVRAVSPADFEDNASSTTSEVYLSGGEEEHSDSGDNDSLTVPMELALDEVSYGDDSLLLSGDAGTDGSLETDGSAISVVRSESDLIEDRASELVAPFNRAAAVVSDGDDSQSLGLPQDLAEASQVAVVSRAVTPTPDVVSDENVPSNANNRCELVKRGGILPRGAINYNSTVCFFTSAIQVIAFL